MTTIHYVLLGFVALVAGLAVAGPRGSALGLVRLGLLTLAAGLTLTPFAWLLCAVIKDPSVMMVHSFLPPLTSWGSGTLTLDNFRMLFRGEATAHGTITFGLYLANSLFLASTQTVVALVLSSLGGYALAMYTFRGRAALMTFMLGTMMIPGMILMAPLYRLLYGFGWLDTWWSLLVPGAVSAFGIFLFRQAFTQVPKELLEAARIDGASEVRIWWQVVMPLVRPMSGAFCLITFLGSWNNFLGPQVYLSSQEKLTLPVVLNQYLDVYQQQYGVFLAGTLIAIIPAAILFFALQKEFVSGLTSGAVKG
jgi:ABC-type glycerol-3-phosphate transport system permease component